MVKEEKVKEDPYVLEIKIYDDREFRDDEQFRNISIFESDLTRTFNCNDMEHSNDIISVVTYYTEIFESIIKNGFNYNGVHFTTLTIFCSFLIIFFIFFHFFFNHFW